MKRTWQLTIALAVVACGGSSDSTGPTSLKVGVYNYAGNAPFLKSDGSVGTTSFSGTLTLTYATSDSIAGTFQVARMRSDTKLGFRNGDAYVLYGFETGSGAAIVHRIKPDLGCTVKYVGSGPDGTCTLSAH